MAAHGSGDAALDSLFTVWWLVNSGLTAIDGQFNQFE
jgi:hypothetical protein